MKVMVLENNNLKIVLLPELGGKIISFLKKDKEFELAAQPSQRIQTNLSDCMDFSEYAYGMDDTFPNIDKEIIIASKLGMIKKTPLKDFKVSRYTKAMCCMKLKENDEIIDAKLNNYNDIMISTSSCLEAIVSLDKVYNCSKASCSKYFACNLKYFLIC